MDGEDEPLFIGFGAFETTAFFTAILVAAYTFISNPEGRQGSFDQSEYEVYSGWRRALTVILTQMMLMIAVLVDLIRRNASRRATWWVMALMLAPWAPIAGQVRRTLSAWRSVRHMMLHRYTRNDIAAVIRDRFKFGQRGIETALVVSFVHSGKVRPVHPINTLRQNEFLSAHVEEIERQAKEAAGIDDSNALGLGVLWIVSQGRQPVSIGKYRLLSRLYLSRVDLLAHFWTRKSFELTYDPFASFDPPLQKITERARILDFIDQLQQGGTISDSLMNRSMRKRFCQRCRMAARGAVEGFLESSVRGHTDLRAKDWLRNIGIQWKGTFEKIMDVMWEAAFMEQDANRLDGYENDRSPSFGDRSKVVTTKTLGLLFIITRSLMGDSPEGSTLAAVSQCIEAGPNTAKWWERYWNKVANSLGAGECASSSIVIDESARSAFKKALRDCIDEDIGAIIDTLLRQPLTFSICPQPEGTCQLSTQSRFILERYHDI